MKKWCGFFVLFVLIMATCFIGYIYLQRAQFVSLALTKALDTPASVQAIDCKSDGLTINGIVIQNPPGCDAKNALSIQAIEMKMSWSGIIKAAIGIGNQKLMVDELRIVQPNMSIELFSITGQDTNWSRILSKLPKGKADQPKKSSGTEFAIKKLIMTDIKLEMSSHGLAQGRFTPSTIERIEIRDIGIDNSVALQDVCVEVISILLKEAAKQYSMNNLSADKILQDYFGPNSDALNQVQNLLQEFLPQK